MSNKKKSYSQRKRDTMDARSEYFKHNPGLFGCIWFCAYCHCAIVGERKVEVDHIIPLNSVFGMNARYNLVAACQRCNRKKSDKVDGRVLHGYISKVLEVILFTIQKIFVVCLVAVWTIFRKSLNWLLQLIISPFHNTSITIKLIALLVYGAALYCLYNSIA